MLARILAALMFALGIIICYTPAIAGQDGMRGRNAEFAMDGAWTNVAMAESAASYVQGIGTSALTWGRAYDDASHPSHATFLGAPNAAAKFLPNRDISRPFAIGTIRYFNGVNTWGTIAYSADLVLTSNPLNLFSALAAPASLVQPVTIAATSNIPDDPIASRDRLVVGTLGGATPIGPYARAFAVPEEGEGEVTVMGRIHMNSGGSATLEVLGFDAPRDSAWLVRDRAVAIAVVPDDQMMPGLPSWAYLEIAVIAPDDLDLTEASKLSPYACGLFGPDAAILQPIWYEYRDVGRFRRGQGHNAPGVGPLDGRPDLVLVFDRASTMESLAASGSGGAMTGVIAGELNDGARIRGEVTLGGRRTVATRPSSQKPYPLMDGAVDLRLSAQFEAAGATRLALAGAHEGPVRLALYDVRGRLVYSSEAVAHGAAELDFGWDPRAVAPGLYVARAQQDERSSICKLAVLR